MGGHRYAGERGGSEGGGGAGGRRAGTLVCRMQSDYLHDIVRGLQLLAEDGGDGEDRDAQESQETSGGYSTGSVCRASTGGLQRSDCLVIRLARPAPEHSHASVFAARALKPHGPR